jgi:hypothetical protein
MFTLISPTGEFITTKSVIEFSEKFNFSRASAQALARDRRSRIRGWCSTHRKATRHRLRFMTKLFHLPTGQECILGQSISAFAKKHGLCMNELWKLVNGHKIAYRGWITKATRDVFLAAHHF